MTVLKGTAAPAGSPNPCHRTDSPAGVVGTRRGGRWRRGAVAGVGAVGFGAIGLVYGRFADVTWLHPLVGLLVGAAFGAGIGWAFSVDNAGSRPRGARRLVYVGVLVLGAVVLVGMRYIRSTT